MYSRNLLNICISGYIFIELLLFSCRTHRVRTAKISLFVSVQYLHRYDSQTHENRLRRWGLLTPESCSYGLISKWFGLFWTVTTIQYIYRSSIVKKTTMIQKFIWWTYLILLFAVIGVKFNGSFTELCDKMVSTSFGTNYNIVPFKTISLHIRYTCNIEFHCSILDVTVQQAYAFT